MPARPAEGLICDRSRGADLSRELGVRARIRRAAAGDASSVASLLRRSFAEYERLYTAAAFRATTPPARVIRERLREGPTWIALADRALIGTVSALARGKALYVRSMAVHPAVRGRGTGRFLLERVESFARRNGFRRLTLSTTPFLTSAIGLYAKAGFRTGGEGPRDLGGTALITMVKTVGRRAMATPRRSPVPRKRGSPDANHPRRRSRRAH